MRFFPIHILVFLLAGCSVQPGRWTWVRADDADMVRYRARDIEECEEKALHDTVNGTFPAVSARTYGEWGSFDFEQCMRERGWRLEFRARPKNPYSEGLALLPPPFPPWRRAASPRYARAGK